MFLPLINRGKPELGREADDFLVKRGEEWRRKNVDSVRPPIPSGMKCAAKIVTMPHFDYLQCQL